MRSGELEEWYTSERYRCRRAVSLFASQSQRRRRSHFYDYGAFVHRYIAILWDHSNPETTRAVQGLNATTASMQDSWTVAFSGVGLRVLHRGTGHGRASAHTLAQENGVVLGTLFDGRETQHATYLPPNFDENETRKIVESAGRYLVDRYWGSYVAFILDRPSHRRHVLCEPTATLPCFWTAYLGANIFFSHVEDCVRFLPISFTTNRSYLGRWLVFNGLKNRECGLNEVERLPGGERITFEKNTIARAQLWKAAELAREAHLEQPETAATQLRGAVHNAVSAWASCYQAITLKLSGGLDSSIVAACLAAAPSRPKVDYLNFSADVGFDTESLHLIGMDANTARNIRATTAPGDERRFARSVAKRWNVPLVELPRVATMDLRRLWAAPLMTTPALYYTGIEIDDVEIEIARAARTQAFFSGQGGDSVFLATQQPFAAIDYAHVHGAQRGILRHLLAAASLSRDSVWPILGKAIGCGLLRRQYRSPVSMLSKQNLLKDDVTSELKEMDFEGAWSGRISSDLPPGKQMHLHGLEGNDFYDYVFHSGLHSEHVDPLNSQPVWEQVLQIPSYTLLCGGVSRGLARRAFADVLPPEVRTRVAKGTGTPFYQRVVRTNLPLFREVLIAGRLVQEGWLDRSKLVACLNAEEPFLMADACDLLGYLSAEIWLDRWSNLARLNQARARIAVS